MPPTLADVQRIVQLVGDKDVSWMLARVPYPYTEGDAKWWVGKVAEDIAAQREYAFGVYLPGDGLIGSCGLLKSGDYWEIGYWFGRPYWEQGFATEAGRAVLDWARSELVVDGFLSGHAADNAASGRVLRKLGFEQVGEIQMFNMARNALGPTTRYVLNAPPEAAMQGHDTAGAGHD